MKPLYSDFCLEPETRAVFKCYFRALMGAGSLRWSKWRTLGMVSSNGSSCPLTCRPSTMHSVPRSCPAGPRGAAGDCCVCHLCPQEVESLTIRCWAGRTGQGLAQNRPVQQEEAAHRSHGSGPMWSKEKVTHLQYPQESHGSL